jgi:hypothetical protein
VTKNELFTLACGTILHHVKAINADGTPLRARVNGRMKVWKTRPNEFRLPMKYGLLTCFYITQSNAHEWVLPED